MENNNGRQKRPRIQRPRVSASYSNNSERPYSSENHYSSERSGRSYSDRQQRSSYGSSRPSYGSDRPARSSYGNDRPSYGDRPQRSSYSPRPARPSRPSYGESDRPSYGERLSYGERPSYEDRPQRKSYGNRPERGNKPGFGGGNRSHGSRQANNSRRQAPKPRKKVQNNYFRDEDQSRIGEMIKRRPVVDNAQFSDNDMVRIPIKEEVRLNKFLANSGVCSRREADNLIQAGCVTVNGEVVTELGTKVNIVNDDVRFNGERMKGEEKVYIVMNKPKGYVTTASDPHADKTVMDLLKECPSRVFPVGRLDKNTTGVLMFTNDGEIAEKLTHPAYDKKKIYQVSLDRDLKQEDYEQILAGVELSDGNIAADELEYIEENDRRKLGIEIHSGKNRIVRRIFESLGYEVKALDRVYFAGLTKKGIKRGEWRYLSEGEANLLKMGAYL